MEVYQNHMGGFYFEEHEIDDDYLYCEQCGDSDYHLGHADTWEDVLGLITELEDDGSKWCPYAEDYVAEKKAEFEKRRNNYEHYSEIFNCGSRYNSDPNHSFCHVYPQGKRQPFKRVLWLSKLQ